MLSLEMSAPKSQYKVIISVSTVRLGPVHSLHGHKSQYKVIISVSMVRLGPSSFAPWPPITV